MKVGDIVKHRLTGERMIVIGDNLWEQLCCRREDLSIIWLEKEELELSKEKEDCRGKS